MTELKRHSLEHKLTITFVRDNLTGAKTLSSELIATIDFSNGNFFVLLPKNADLKHLYDFETGGILPQNPLQKFAFGERESTYSVIPTIQDEISNFILREMSQNPELSCVFEEILDSLQSPQLHFFKEHSVLYTFQDEVYYLIKKGRATESLVSKCIEKSNAIWHSLCVLTEANLDNVQNGTLSASNLKNICQRVRLIMIGAYDGEGYIFWEKK